MIKRNMCQEFEDPLGENGLQFGPIIEHPLEMLGPPLHQDEGDRYSVFFTKNLVFRGFESPCEDGIRHSPNAGFVKRRV